MEDAITEHPAIAEAAVVGFPHDVKGEGVYAFITLKEGFKDKLQEVELELKQIVKQKISGFAVPEVIQFTPGLPKTRSGKIMRRILRKVAASQTEDLGDISTLADPGVVEIIVNNHNNIINSRDKTRLSTTCDNFDSPTGPHHRSIVSQEPGQYLH